MVIIKSIIKSKDKLILKKQILKIIAAIIKQICPERNITFKRIRGREVQEIVYITYVSMSI